MTQIAKKFESFDSYESWTEKYENRYGHDYEEVLVVIDDGWKIACDLMTECKTWQTAVRRFTKLLKDASPEAFGWAEGIKESCESGYFSDTTGWQPAWMTDPEEIKNAAKNGMYSWGVEAIGEDRYYVFLNISGVYANRT